LNKQVTQKADCWK